MVAGTNVRLKIWRMVQQDDDEVGGSVYSGTAVYDNVLGRLTPNPEEQLLLQQGLETQRTFSASVIPGTLSLQERDEIEVIYPPMHVYVNKRFRIIGLRYSDFAPRDPRSYILLNLVRSEEAHSRQ